MNATAALPAIDAVAIGASAGGIETLSQILPALAADLRVPVFIVQHLPRQQPSLLVEIFAPRCAIRVIEAQDKEAIEPATVYFAPPDYHLLVESRGELALSDGELVQFSRPSIDVLFESAADVFGTNLLGIVLTGANEDGAAGLAAIRAAGGTAVVQDPQSARTPAMPGAALERVPDARVMGAEGIVALLNSLGTTSPTSAAPGASR